MLLITLGKTVVLLSCKAESPEGWPIGTVKKACSVTALGFKGLPPATVGGWSELEEQENSDMPFVPQFLTSSTSTAIVLSSQDCLRDTKF